jgi:hypothetical protein
MNRAAGFWHAIAQFFEAVDQEPRAADQKNIQNLSWHRYAEIKVL